MEEGYLYPSSDTIPAPNSNQEKPMPPSHPSYSYIILGAGRQGTAAAYDLVRFGEPAKIVLADPSTISDKDPD